MIHSFVGEPRTETSSSRSEQICRHAARSRDRRRGQHHISEMEWSKYTMFVPLFCGALHHTAGNAPIPHPPEERACCRAAPSEMAQLAQAEGVLLHPAGPFGRRLGADRLRDRRAHRPRGRRAIRAEGAATTRCPVCRTLSAGGPTEVEEIAGYAWRRSEELGLALTTLAHLLSPVQRHIAAHPDWILSSPPGSHKPSAVVRAPLDLLAETSWNY